MKSRLATLVVLIGLTWFLYDVGRTEDLNREPPSVGGRLFPGLEPASVDYVSMRFRTGHVVDIEREPGGPWRITYPPEANELAQAEFVERVIENLSLATVIPVEDQGAVVDPADVGLDKTTYSITFGIAGHRTTLAIGDREVFGKGIYARREGDDQILLTSPNLRTMVEQFRAEDYVDKHLLRGLNGPVDRVRLVKPEGVVVDASLRGGTWSLDGPVPSRGDDSRISSLVRSLQFSRQVLVAAVEPDDETLATLGLPNAAQLSRGDWADSTMVEFHAGAEQPVRLFLQKDWAERSDAIYVIREDLYKLLEAERNEFNLLVNGPDFFRERRLLPPVRERAHRFAIQRGEDILLDIRRDGRGQWAFSSPGRLSGIEVDTHRIEGRSSLSDFLQRFDGVEASGFCDPPEGEPEAVLSVSFDQAGVTRDERVELFDLDQPTLRARATWRPGEGLLLGNDVVALLDPFVADELRGLTPLAVSMDRLAELQLIAADGETLGVSRADDGSWVGDDEWGRRFGLGHDFVNGFRGYGWRRERSDALYDWTVRFLDGDGAALGELAFRRPGPEEAGESLGVPVHLAQVSGVTGAEMVVPAFWLDRLDTLRTPQGREALQTVPIKPGS